MPFGALQQTERHTRLVSTLVDHSQDCDILATGRAGLSFFNISAEDILASVGLSPLELWIYLHLFIDWAIPNMILGAFIVVPIWLVIYLLRPPAN